MSHCGAVHAPARIGVKDDLAVDAARRRSPWPLMRRRRRVPAHRPELRHDEVGVDVGEAPRAHGAQVVHANDARFARRRCRARRSSGAAARCPPRRAARRRHGARAARPVQARLTPTSAATSGSSQTMPVSRTSSRPTTTPALVQKSERTCLPSATSVSECVAAPGADEESAEAEVDHPGGAGDGHARDRAGAPRRRGGSSARLVDDHHRGEGDQPAFEGRGEELDLAVAVRVVAVGRPAGEDQAAEGEDGGDHVDDALERVGEDRGGAGELLGEVLGDEQRGAEDQGQRPRSEPDPEVRR